MRNILRVVIHEAIWKRQLQELLELCEQAPIQEVLLMEQSHQLLTSPFPIDKHLRMAKIFAYIGQELRLHGVEFGVNLATCIGHGDAQVPARYQLPFQRQVGDSMKLCKAVYCMTDWNWVKYAAKVCAIYAGCGPKRLMIDDDFRTLNHADAIGCFCSEHAHRVSKKLGYKMDGETLRKLVCKNTSEGVNVRKVWMEVTFEAQKKAAKEIEKAVHAVDPKIQIGLMNSGEPAHSVQGRNMEELLKTFAGSSKRPLSRPAGGAYEDCTHLSIVEMHQMPALSACVAGKETEFISEVENWPHSQFNKSFRLTDLQMKLHTLWGADALSLNIYDYLGTPFQQEPTWAELLRKNVADIEKISRARAGKTLVGVGRPWDARSAAHTVCRTEGIKQMLPDRRLDNILPLLGIPVQFSIGEINFIQGDEALCGTNDEWKELLKGKLLLDGIAAGHLCDRGLEEYLGCSLREEIDRPVMECLNRQEYAGEYCGCMLPTAWSELRQNGIPLYQLSNLQGQAVSSFFDEEWNEISPAVSLYHNTLGGQICVLACPIHTVSWLHRGKGVLLRNILRKMGASELFPMVEDKPNVAPFYYKDFSTGNSLLALVNCGFDEQTFVPQGFCPMVERQEDGKLPPLSVRFFTRDG